VADKYTLRESADLLDGFWLRIQKLAELMDAKT